jgi:hypothetical protein
VVAVVDVVVVVVVPVVVVLVVAAAPVVAAPMSAAGVPVVAVVDVVVVSSTTFGASVVVVSFFSSVFVQPAATRREAETAPRAIIDRNFFMSIISFFRSFIAEVSDLNSIFSPGIVSRVLVAAWRNTLNEGAQEPPRASVNEDKASS